jgi:hypothetical protein
MRSAANADPAPLRQSRASCALIRDAGGRLLLQWNEKWGVMNLVSGHLEPEDQGSYLACMVRELHEELWPGRFPEIGKAMPEVLRLGAGMAPGDEVEGREWGDPFVARIAFCRELGFQAFSESARQRTEYRFSVYAVELSPEGREALTAGSGSGPKAINEWVSVEDVRRGRTPLGRPISGTVATVLEGLGLLE